MFQTGYLNRLEAGSLDLILKSELGKVVDWMGIKKRLGQKMGFL